MGVLLFCKDNGFGGQSVKSSIVTYDEAVYAICGNVIFNFCL